MKQKFCACFVINNRNYLFIQKQRRGSINSNNENNGICSDRKIVP